ncbi:UxaA family hydrolase [Alphaproteobacteria bacterium LSUCC0684]
MQLDVEVGRRFVVLNPSDNVATLLDEKTEVNRLSDGMRIADHVPFGHKVSLHPIAVGDAIVKYGVMIGMATKPIKKGEHVHVHNCQ